MSTEQKKLLFYRCYYCFLINGMVVLLIGAVLPYLIAAAGINYTIAGGLLSIMAVGNLSASFVNPILAKAIGRKKTVILLSALFPLCLTVITFLPGITVLYLCFFLMGMARGTVSIFNNSVVNDFGDGTPASLNILHTFFALGAFIAPFLTSTMIHFSFDWRQILYVMIVLYLTALISFISMPVNEEIWNAIGKKAAAESREKNTSYLKNFHFYCIGFILFFYLGMENCVNGWFVTYLQDIGVMSNTYATNLVSVIWIVIMVGRLTCAYLSKKTPKKTLLLTNCIGSAIAFLILISTKNITIITLAMAGLGFFLAGIYPTCVSSAGSLFKGTASGMPVLMAMAALGGIIAPQVVGWIGDSSGIAGGISVLSIDVVIMVGFAVINYWQSGSPMSKFK